MGVLTIGRVELEEGSAPDPGMTWEGDKLSFSGIVKADTLDGVKALRAQVVGLADNTDEPVVPVTWADDPDIDGFYRVLSTSVGTVGASYTACWFPFEVDLERVPGWQSPLMEVICRGADRSTAHGVTPWSWVGSGTPLADWEVTVFTGLDSASGASTATMHSDQGDTVFFYANTGDKDDLYTAEMTFQTDPDNWYKTAATLEQSYDGGAHWHALIGRQGRSESPWNWRLSNGTVRVTPSATEPSFTLEVWDDTNGVYVSKGFDVKDSLGTPPASGWFPTSQSPGTPPKTLTVLRNSPEVVSVRNWYNDATTGGSGYLDFTLRRGAWWVEGFVVLAEGAQFPGIVRSTAETGTSVTGGVDAASTDGDGYIYQIRTPNAYDVDSTNGGAFSQGDTLFPFAVSIDVGEPEGSPVTVSNTYFAAMSHRQQVAAR